MRSKFFVKYFVEKIQFTKEYLIESKGMKYFMKGKKIFLCVSNHVTQITLSKNIFCLDRKQKLINILLNKSSIY